MLDPELLQRYAWAERSGDLSWTLAVITGRDRDDVISAYGGDVGQEPASMRFDDADVGNGLGVYSLVHVREEGVHLVLIENNGWVGTSDTSIAERSSANGGHFIGIHWDVNANTWLAEARDGKLVANFEPLNVANEPDAEPLPPAETWHTYPDWLADVGFTIGSVRTTMLAVVEWRSGLAFERRWLDQPMPTYRVPYPKPEASQPR